MKQAIIMGASSGMGREVALLLLERGWKIGIAARRMEPLELIRQTAPDRVVARCIDVTDPLAGQQLHDLMDDMGHIDLYLHVSGVGKQNMQLTADIELQTVDTNALGFTRLVGVAFRWMASHGGGHIAVISSVAGTKGLGPAPSYSATKAFQNTYIEALEQLAHSRRLPIVFTDIRPGFVDTPLLSGSRFPMTMNARHTACLIVMAILAQKHVAVIDRRYAVLTFFWRLVPRWIWRRLRLVSDQTT